MYICACVCIGLVGLAISYALSVTNLLGGVVTSFTETEKEMVSVERAMQYIVGTPSERREVSFYVSHYNLQHSCVWCQHRQCGFDTVNVLQAVKQHISCVGGVCVCGCVM